MFINFFYEIQVRSLLILATWSFTFITCYFYKELILFNIVQPYLTIFNKSSCYFIFTNMTEIFSTHIFLCSFVTNQFVMFLLYYQVLLFLTPGLYKIECSFLNRILKINLIGLGCLITVFQKYLLPMSCEFFLTFQNAVNLHAVNFYFEAKLNEYLDFYITFYFLLLLNFQFFLLIFLIGNRYTQIVQKATTFRKFFYFLFFISATVLTPPDIISQLLVCTSLIWIYEIVNFLNIFQINIKYYEKSLCIYNSNG
jgi:sec-independent protein translocase protein TatC